MVFPEFERFTEPTNDRSAIKRHRLESGYFAISLWKQHQRLRISKKYFISLY